MVRPVDPARAAARRQQIMEAAGECFRTHGFQQTSMAAICAAAGLSPGALYRYFPSKDALICAIMQQHIAALRDLSDTGSGASALRDFARMVFCVQADEQGLRFTAEVFAEAGRRPEILAHIEHARGEATKSLRRLIAKGQAQDDFSRAVDADLAASSLICLLDGLIFQAITSSQVVMAADALNIFEQTAMAILAPHAKAPMPARPRPSAAVAQGPSEAIA